MDSFADLIAPLAAFLAALPAVTLALLLWRRSGDRSFELLATGLGLMAVLAFLLSLGIFLFAARLIANPELRFVMWNTTYLFSFASLLVLRRFESLVTPGAGALWAFPRGFTLAAAAVYGGFLLGAFGTSPRLIDFGMPAVYAASAALYVAGFLGPTLRLWRARASLPPWIDGLFRKAPLAVGLPALAIALLELARFAGLLGPSWPSLAGLAAAAFFGLVTFELFRFLARPEAWHEVSARSAVPGGSAAEEKARRVAARCVADPLTRREFEVLVLLLDGFRNADIALRLGLSGSTVKNHVYSLYQKTGVANRIELSALAD